jgi:aromatic ring-opening dioxygenase LigB subunit
VGVKMSIVFAALSPHPPIIIPEIGGSDSKKCIKTIQALEKLGELLEKADPEIIIVISPHGLVYPDKMNICGMKNLIGNFSQFNHPEIKFNFQNDLDLAIKIDNQTNKENIETILYDNGSPDKVYELDHGVMVPLYFLTKHISNVKILPISYSFLSRGDHFDFGEIIARVSGKKRVALIASGDLSHRLIPQAPAGYTPVGKKFDEKLLSLIKTNNNAEILELNEGFIEEAGECGYRSLLILLGAIHEQQIKPEILSYEGSFGVGYGVIDFKIS